MYREEVEFEASGRSSQQEKQHEQARRSQVHGDQIDPACTADRLLSVIGQHQKERSQRHAFPADKEQQPVSRRHDEKHACRQQIEEEPGRSDAGRGIRTLHVGNAIHCRDRNDEGNRKDERRRKRIDTQRKAPQRNLPGESRFKCLSRPEDRSRSNEGRQASGDSTGGARPRREPGSFRQEQGQQCPNRQDYQPGSKQPHGEHSQGSRWRGGDAAVDRLAGCENLIARTAARYDIRKLRPLKGMGKTRQRVQMGPHRGAQHGE